MEELESAVVKKLVFIILAVVLYACNVGCGAPDAPQDDTPDVTREPLTLAEITETIMESADFPAMITYTEQSDIEMLLPNINFDDIEEIVLIQQAMTVHLIEVIVIKPADGKAREVLDFLRERQKTLKEQLAFYPAQVLSAEASVIESWGGIIFLICHEEAKEIRNTVCDTYNYYP